MSSQASGREAFASYGRAAWASKLGHRLLVIAMCVVAVFPFYWLIVSSVLPTEKLFSFPPQLIPTDGATVEPYKRALTESDLPLWLLNSFKVAAGTAFVAVLVGSICAYAISRFRFRGRGPTALAMLVTQMFPDILIVLPMYVLFAQLGLLDSLFGLSLAYLAFLVPVSAALLKGFFDAIPVDVEHAAMMDGASRLRTYRDIVLPLALPGLVSTYFFAFIVAWDEYLFARTFLTSEDNWTGTLGLSSYFGAYTTPWDQVMSSAVLMTIPVAVLFLILQRYLLRGLTAGAIRG